MISMMLEDAYCILSQSIGSGPKNVPEASPPDPHFAAPFLICPRHAATQYSRNSPTCGLLVPMPSKGPATASCPGAQPRSRQPWPRVYRGWFVIEVYVCFVWRSDSFLKKFAGFNLQIACECWQNHSFTHSQWFTRYHKETNPKSNVLFFGKAIDFRCLQISSWLPIAHELPLESPRLNRPLGKRSCTFELALEWPYSSCSHPV